MDNSRDDEVPEGTQPNVHLPSADARGRRLKSRGGSTTDGLFMFERTEAGSAGRPPHWHDRLLTYGSHVALAACLFGFAWAGGVYFSGKGSPLDILKPSPSPGAVSPVAVSQESVERAEMLRATQKITEDIRALKANVEALRASQSQTAKDAALLESLKTRLEVVKSETGASIAELAGKVERMQREPGAKLAQIIERLDRMEHQIAAPLAAGSAATGSAAAAAANPGKPPRTAEAKPFPEPAGGQRAPQLITNWVVRDVYDGIALLESPHGSIEVIPGEIVPGAGIVKAIERRGAGWIVITSRGVVDSARDAF